MRARIVWSVGHREVLQQLHINHHHNNNQHYVNNGILNHCNRYDSDVNYEHLEHYQQFDCHFHDQDFNIADDCQHHICNRVQHNDYLHQHNGDGDVHFCHPNLNHVYKHHINNNGHQHERYQHDDVVHWHNPHGHLNHNL